MKLINAVKSCALLGLALFCPVLDASASTLEYKLFVVDSNGNPVSGLKTQAQIHGINIPLIGELQLNDVSMFVSDSNIKLQGEVEVCVGTNGCGSKYATDLFSFTTLYGFPIGHGTGDLNATLTAKLSSSTPEAQQYGAQNNVGKIIVDEIDPRLPENYAQVTVSTKLNPTAGYAFGVFADQTYGLDFVKVDGWLVLEQFLAASKFYVETRSGSGQFNFHVVGCLVGGSAGGICGHNPPPQDEVPEPMTLSLLISGLVGGARLRMRKA